ncbi:hypothetical protein, partial [Gluconobacter kondonii]|uniref:hypothetical protein n=1 Tax=Gluconobacter kondonii TaxID=941463 RepID=UPI001B8B1F00
EGKQQRRQNGGMTTTGYSLFKPKNCPNRRGHLFFDPAIFNLFQTFTNDKKKPYSNSINLALTLI